MKKCIYYSPTKVYFGNYEEEVGKVIHEYGYKKVLFHFGKHSIYQSGLYQIVIQSLKQYQIDYVELGGVEPNPKIDLVRKGVNLVKTNEVDFILAVGGGSVIDSAKAIACGAKVDFDPWLFSTHEKTPSVSLSIGVILTISAAGSELSNSCVITHPNLKIKNGFNSDIIRPIFAIMNPKLTCSVSKYQTACGIVDIMMHTMERYFVDESLTFTDEMAIGLLKSVVHSGKRVMENLNDEEARASLMIASSFSHNGLTGIGKTMYFSVHKLEHILSGTYDYISHGAGLAVLFPAWAKWVYPNLREKFDIFVTEVMQVKEENIDKRIIKGIAELKHFFHEIGMPTSFTELGLNKEQVEELAMIATNHGTTTIPGFIKLDINSVRKIFELAI